MQTVGNYLKSGREAKNISLSEVARTTKISKWYLDCLEQDNFDLVVTIPANTEGVVRLPARSIDDITEQGQPLSYVEGIREVQQEDETVILTVGSHGKTGIRIGIYSSSKVHNQAIYSLLYPPILPPSMPDAPQFHARIC